MIRKFTGFIAVVMIIVVATGYIPGFVTHQHHPGMAMGAGGEKEVLGLYMINALDDITHGLTAVWALFAAFKSRRASLLFLTAFGWYYALDAIFYLLYGFVNDKPYSADIMLNLPHVILSGLMLWFVYFYAPREDARQLRADEPMSG